MARNFHQTINLLQDYYIQLQDQLEKLMIGTMQVNKALSQFSFGGLLSPLRDLKRSLEEASRVLKTMAILSDIRIELEAEKALRQVIAGALPNPNSDQLEEFSKHATNVQAAVDRVFRVLGLISQLPSGVRLEFGDCSDEDLASATGNRGQLDRGFCPLCRRPGIVHFRYRRRNRLRMEPEFGNRCHRHC